MQSKGESIEAGARWIEINPVEKWRNFDEDYDLLVPNIRGHPCHIMPTVLSLG